MIFLYLFVYFYWRVNGFVYRVVRFLVASFGVLGSAFVFRGTVYIGCLYAPEVAGCVYDIIWYYMILYDIIWYYMILYDIIWSYAYIVDGYSHNSGPQRTTLVPDVDKAHAIHHHGRFDDQNDWSFFRCIYIYIYIYITRWLFSSMYNVWPISLHMSNYIFRHPTWW
jgi:hypothetical protein